MKNAGKEFNDVGLTFQIPNKTSRNQKYFLYMGKKYPIDFNLLMQNSNYFYENRKQYKFINVINLLNDEEEQIDITDESIKIFISCCQNQPSRIDLSTVFPVHYLSKKFDFPELTSITEQFIEQHSSELVFQLIQFNKSLNPNAIMQKEESIIASHLEQYIKDERMILLPIPVLYRILQIYINKSDKKSIKDAEIIQFLFKCLDKYGEDASILYNDINFEDTSIEVTSRLIKHYSNKFNFNMIGSTLLKTTIDLINDKEKSCILLNEMKIKLDEKEKEFEQLKSQYKNDIDKLKKEEEKRYDEYTNEINKLKEEINLKDQIRNFEIKGYSKTVLQFIPQMKYYLKSDTGKIVYISNSYPNPLISNSNSSNDPYTSIFFIRNSDYTISLKSAINGKYVTVDVNKEGQLFAQSDSISINEKFIMVDMPNGGFAFQSLANNKYVCNLRKGYINLTEDSLTAYVNHKDTWETFLIYSNDGKQIK